jgi:hypothetical protein
MAGHKRNKDPATRDPGLPARWTWAGLDAEGRARHIADWAASPERRARRHAAAAVYLKRMGAAAKLGLIPGFPNRITVATVVRHQGGRRLPPAEMLRLQALREIAWMEDLDKRIAALQAENPDLPMATHGDQFRDITGDSMAVFKKILSAPVPFDDDHIRLIREQREAAATTIRVGARIAIEMYRGQHLDALQILAERIKTADLRLDDDEIVDL